MTKIPAKGKAIDGVSILPGRELIPFTDWDTLEAEFVVNPDYTRVAAWLRDVKGWTQNKINSGNTQRRIVGWGSKRVEYRQAVAKKLHEDSLQAERELLPLIRQAKLELIRHAIQRIKVFSTLEASEKRVIYNIIKVELGEPTNIKVVESKGDTRDPVMALLEAYGLMQDGVIIDAPELDEDNPVSVIEDAPEPENETQDDTYNRDSSEVATISSSTPAQVS